MLADREYDQIGSEQSSDPGASDRLTGTTSVDDAGCQLCRAQHDASLEFNGQVSRRFREIDRHAALMNAPQLIGGSAADVTLRVHYVYEIRREDLLEGFS